MTNKMDIHSKIFKAAREEFIRQGFKNASMRMISKRSGVGLSNIYNYYKSKDEIYRTVLNPILQAFHTLCKKHNGQEYQTIDVFTMKSYQRMMLDDFMVIVREHRTELKLLLFHSEGSSLESFRDDFTRKQTLEGINYLKGMKEKYPYINCDISPFFIHTLTSMWLTVLGEVAIHDHLTSNDIEIFMAEFVSYGTGGWKELLNAHSS